SNQPHYIILAENNKICYAAQDLISKCLPKEINNIAIGRYFYRFEGTHYVPNKNLQQRYPYD
ncbi:F-box only protein 21, partial [Camponotus floridanus]